MADDFDAGVLPPAAPERLGAPKVAPDEVRREPGKMYEGRRRILLIASGIVVILFFCTICKLASNPFGGVDVALGATSGKDSAPAGKTVTAGGGLFGPGVAVTPGVTPASTSGGLLNSLQPGSSGLSGLSSGESSTSSRAAVPVMPAAPVNVFCRAASNFQAASYDIPKSSLFQVDGFSYAAGGEVHVIDPPVGWVAMVYASCPPEVVGLERPFFLGGTPTPKGASSSSSAIVRVVTVQVPVPQTVAPAAVNGIVMGTDGCLTFSIQGVVAIYADKTPVVGGSRLCGVSSFTVNVH